MEMEKNLRDPGRGSQTPLAGQMLVSESAILPFLSSLLLPVFPECQVFPGTLLRIEVWR